MSGDFPHLVELELPAGGFRNKSQEFESVHRERRIVIRRGCARHEGEQFRVRFCFPDAAAADAFQGRFGGTRLTHSPSKPGRPSGPRSRVSALLFAARCRRQSHDASGPTAAAQVHAGD
jgi:hypothetical protein